VEYPVVEHGSSRPGRWLRSHRIKLALAIVAVEAVLVVSDLLSGWIALGIVGLVLAFHVLVGRNLRLDAGRQASSIAALSQILVALLPVLAFLLGAIALIAVGLLALVAVVALLAARR
jgi:hypothetical protein